MEKGFSKVGNIGAGHDPCAKVGENHRQLTATNVAVSNGSKDRA